tara:strand:- start:107 stop:631 length:525 start_codon:yes stop_codon:yes gene_type:complete
MANSDHREGQMAATKNDRVFLALSGINGWSLVFAGAVSLLIAAIARSLAGVLISLAVLGHGSLELRFRKAASENRDGSRGRTMAFNQMGLAASVSLYLAYQALILEPTAVIEALMRPPVSDALNLYPLDMRRWIIHSSPRFIEAFYALAAAISWIVCGATAAFYWPRSSRVAAS